jgi:arylsulfatase A-like enzyme
MSSIQPPRNILCVVVDRLQAGMVGAYGNTWIQTPGFDRLAAEGFLCERAVIDSPRLQSLYRSYWQGLHAMAPAGVSANETSSWSAALPQRLNEAGVATSLVTDEPWLVEHLTAAGFVERELVATESVSNPAGDIEETQLARLFAVASARLAQLPQPFCLWLHAGSIGRLWDAPLELRNRYADEDDPPPSESVEVPCRWLPVNFDPDELLTIVQAYAAQVALLDVCLAGLLDALAESSAAPNTLVAVLSARGFPLGEHGRLGPADEALYSETTQIPWLLRLPDGLGACERTQALVQPADLQATLAEWCGLETGTGLPLHPAQGRSLLPLLTGANDGAAYPRDRACISAGPNEQAIITPAWFLRAHRSDGTADATGQDRSGPDQSGTQIELYAKPEDRFEVNEVSNRAVDVVSDLVAALAQFEQACQSAEAIELAPLSPALAVGID